MRLISTLLLLFICDTVRATDPCNNIQFISCGVSNTFSLSGPGDSTWINGLGNPAWFQNSGIGGKERIYQMPISSSGNYQFNIINLNGTIIEFFWRYKTSVCDTSVWHFLEHRSFNGPLAGIHLEAGDTVQFLLNSEGISPFCEFRVDCFPDICTTIQQESCNGNVVQILWTGYGDEQWENGLGNPAWCTNSGQGGLEYIYRLVAPYTGNYQLRIESTLGTIMEYYWKYESAGCDTTGWNYISHGGFAGSVLARHFNTGDSILFLLNAESVTDITLMQFDFVCWEPVCSTITPITCGTTVPFASIGHGDPDYPNGLGNPSWFYNSGQGGQEMIYSFVAPTSCTYQVNILSSNSYKVEYFWKPAANGCDTTGWNFIGIPTVTTMTPFSLNAGDSIYILVNAESTAEAVKDFSIGGASCCTVGIEEALFSANSFTVSPNPCSICNITTKLTADQFTLMDVAGRTVPTIYSKTESGYSFQLPENGGIFFLKDLETGKVVKVLK